MKVKGWKYYNHAAVPTTSPHEKVDTSAIENGQVWKIGGRPLLARWITDFDCGHETNWWYVIKDEPFDIENLKSKRRYEIKKGIKNFEVRHINPADYKDEIYKVQVAAFSAYPEKYRPTIVEEDFKKQIDKWNEYDIFGAFHKETEELVGYALLSNINDKFVAFNVLKTNPEHEKHAVNAALVHGLMDYYKEFLSAGGIISDGARSINHETHFQDYLEKYFCFRKAYCHLNIKYNPKVGWLIKMLYPFKRILLKVDGIRIVHLVNAVLKMEEIVRK